MICPKCEQAFNYIDVPSEDRTVKTLHSEFICPCCRVQLKSSIVQTVLVNSSLAILTLSGIAVLLTMLEYINMDNRLLGLISIASSVIYFLSSKNQSTQVA